MSDPFEEHLERWQAWAEAPWGRIRFAVVRHTLARHVADLAATVGGRPLRILDVGGGDARDALPLAAAGHDVTVLDPAPGMLAEARRLARDAGVTLGTLEHSLDDLEDPRELGELGELDLLLCHFVLHYRPASEPDVRRLAALLRPGGLLSLAAPQPGGRVLPALVREGPSAALAALAAAEQSWSSTVFAHAGRPLPLEEAAADVVAAGLEVVACYGGRIANDLVSDDAAKQDPAFYADLERLELALCDREPFWRAGQFWQLVARRPG